MQVEPVLLSGRFAQLEPMRPDHAAGLLAAGDEASIWTYLLVPQPTTLAEMRAWMEAAFEQQRAGIHVPFTIRALESGSIVGTTRYLDIRPFDDALEIGWTWLAPEARRTPINTECKYLLLRHAFENLGCVRVQLKTDAKNTRSRDAIERLGAQPEGILRNYQRYWHGTVRDTAMYSIVDSEWPAVKERLEAKLG